MQKLILVLTVIILISCKEHSTNNNSSTLNILKEKAAINAMLDSFNVAAARADYEGYFNFYAADASFIGTDATENWDKEAFMKWAKPHFDKKRTWDFKSIQRTIYFGTHPDIAWFDELLNTQMKICRGSGVLVKQDSSWKVQQYVLSMTFPNEKIDDVLPLKAAIEDSLIEAMEEK